jgi:Flp pilus assembly protein TadG
MVSSPIKQRRPTCRAGSVTVETALVLPLVLMLILGVFEYGRYAMTVQLFDNAAREGVRYAITHLQPVTLDGTTYGNATSDVANIISAVTPRIALVNQTIDIYASDDLGNRLGNWNDAQGGQSVTVKISGSYQVTIAAFLHLPSRLPVVAQSTMNVEVH